MTRTTAEANAYNRAIIDEFRANAGRVGGPWAGSMLILLHHIGAQVRDRACHAARLFPAGDGRYVFVASNGGSLTHPASFRNLKANPRIDVELGDETFTVLAEELNDAARAELWPKLVDEVSQLRTFQTRVKRQIPVFMLTRLWPTDNADALGREIVLHVD
jgi:deazaflavin-dependent oxidoreductase (nitroreductase family)